MLKPDGHLWKALVSASVLIGLIYSPAIANEPIPQNVHQCPVQNALVPRNVAVILKTASTNTDCERFYVTPSGHVSFVIGNKAGQGTLRKSRTQKFFADLKAAEPLSKLPVDTCVKSVSFGTSTFVSLDGEQSPDVSCPGNANAKQLFDDTNAIRKAFQP